MEVLIELKKKILASQSQSKQGLYQIDGPIYPMEILSFGSPNIIRD